MGLCSTTLGFVVLAAKLMDRGRADIIDANIHVDHLTPEGGHNAQPRACAGAHTPAHKIASNNTESSESNPKECRLGGGGAPRLAGLYGHPRAKAPASRSVGNHELGMVLEAYDANDDRTHVKRK